ncbi:MAG: glycoside hydrolase family 9 protein [Pseudomonadota bacterium]
MTVRIRTTGRRARDESAFFSDGSAIAAATAIALSLSLGCRPVPEAATPSGDAGGAALVPPPPAGNNLLKESTFERGTSIPWMTSFTAPAAGSAEVTDGAYCVTVTEKGENPWDAQFRHREMVIQKDHQYSLVFKIWSSAPTQVRPKLGMAGPPYTEYWGRVIDVTPTPAYHTATIRMMRDDDPTAELAFHIGGSIATAPLPYRICIDDVRLEDPQFAPPPERTREPPPRVAVNQIGYFPRGIKVATVRTSATEPVAWELVDASGKAVANGTTTVFGNDAASGEHVHVVDFSAFTTPGTGYVLRVGTDASYPFDVGTELYSRLKYDALAFFYHNRSGIEIRMPYAGDPALARPAGHESDKSVPCQPGSGCSYSLDVSGGWYDAGDHGKYVVNGGISVWTLLNLYERTRAFGSPAVFADGTMNIPENANRVPDLLDEARWEMEFLLRMQVPEGQPLAGLVHHKMHDAAWTGLGLAPHEDKQPRFLHEPSTAATLNLAATGAQCARIWRTIDAAFSKRCLEAAERAYAAALKHPSLLADPKDTNGGGAYDDDDVTDEFYWAAAELFATTGKPEYKSALEASPHHARFPAVTDGHPSSMTWRDTAALGMISLAVARSDALAKTMRGRVIETADAYLAVQAKEGYRTPVAPNREGRYTWGSNAFVLNNALVLALAYDFAKQKKYLDGVVLAMDYLLGRNPLAQSYVTGYGERPLENPHHRFWAHQAVATYPKPPPGIVSGGPNSRIEDPYSQAAGLKGCVPQKCFVDHIEAWSVNEITINWNAPFAWVAAFLDEKAKN